MKNVYAVLVTYNREEKLVYDSISHLIKQCKFIVVCNNSSIEYTIDLPNVKIFNFRNNLGIAKAQSIGMNWAFKNGADFILQMDQDSIPPKNLVGNLIECYNDLTLAGFNVGMVGSQDYDKDSGQISTPLIKKDKISGCKNYIIVNEILSSGSLIPIAAYSKVGLMRDDLFIDLVDFEYCWRLRAAGLIVVKNPNALLAHKLGDGQLIFAKYFKVNVPAAIRHYYQFRNSILLMRSELPSFSWKIIALIKLCLKLIFYPIILDNGTMRFSYMLEGLRDGVLNKSGKYPGDCHNNKG